MNHVEGVTTTLPEMKPSVSPTPGEAPLPALEPQIFQGSAAITALQPEWDKLFARSVDASPHLSFAWLRAFLSLSTTRRPVVLTLWHGPQLVALLPLTLHRTVGLRVATHLGTGSPSYLGVLTDAQYPQAPAALAQLCRNLTMFDVLALEDMNDQDPSTRQFLEGLGAQGYKLRQVPRNVAHVIKLTGTYEQYLTATKSTKRRHELRREERKLKDTGQVVFEHYCGAQITAALLARLPPIQKESWLSQRGADILEGPFFQTLLRQLADSGMARLWIITINGDDAAFGLGCLSHRQFHYMWTAFKQQYLSLSVGKALTNRLLHDLCAEGIDSFDFGHGDAEYKRFWGTHTSTIYRVVAAQNLRGKLYARALERYWLLKNNARLRDLYHRARKMMRR